MRPKRFLSLWYVWCKPFTYLAPTLTLSPNAPNKIPHDPCNLGVPSRASKTFSEPMVCSTQTVQLSCVKISTISKWGVLSLQPRHQGVPSGASKTISEPMVHLTQTVHLSCTDTNTVSNQTKMSFHMIHIS